MRGSTVLANLSDFQFPSLARHSGPGPHTADSADSTSVNIAIHCHVWAVQFL
jgi:hypothetical protein